MPPPPPLQAIPWGGGLGPKSLCTKNGPTRFPDCNFLSRPVTEIPPSVRRAFTKQVKGQQQARVWVKARVPCPRPCQGTAGGRGGRVPRLAPPESPRRTGAYALTDHPAWTLQSSSYDGIAEVLQWGGPPCCKISFFPRWPLWSGAGGGTPPPAVYSHSNTSLVPPQEGRCGGRLSGPRIAAGCDMRRTTGVCETEGLGHPLRLGKHVV